MRDANNLMASIAEYRAYAGLRHSFKHCLEWYFTHRTTKIDNCRCCYYSIIENVHLTAQIVKTCVRINGRTLSDEINQWKEFQPEFQTRRNECATKQNHLFKIH